MVAPPSVLLGGATCLAGKTMTTPAPLFDDRMTFEEYLAFEERSTERHEFVDGRVYAMTGGTRAHHRAGFNIAKHLDARIKSVECEVFHNDFKLRTPRGNAYYPDVVLACVGPIPNNALFVSDPCLVVEVLSPSTARTDLSEKLVAYEEYPSLQAYWIVEATWRGVQRHWRDPGGEWLFEWVRGEGMIPVPCLGGDVTLGQIYDGIDVPYEPPRPSLRRIREPDPAPWAD